MLLLLGKRQITVDRGMRKILVFIICALQLCSCRVVDKIFKGEIIARVGNNVLYKEDIIDLIPKNCSPEDSSHIVQQYIYSWATKHLLLDKAESKLSNEDLDVDKELEDFRRSLLVYRYEKLLVDQKLDTLITNEECEAYYKNNPQSFISSVSVVRARYIKVSNSSPNLQIIKSLYKSYDIDDSEKLSSMCYSSADKFYNFNNQWVSLDIIARELGSDVNSCERELDGNKSIEKDNLGYTQLVSVSERIRPGEAAPFDYCLPRIKEILLSKRKQELISSLERNLLNDAMSSNKLLIYSK